jgi:hypothetical protein
MASAIGAHEIGVEKSGATPAHQIEFEGWMQSFVSYPAVAHIFGLDRQVLIAMVVMMDLSQWMIRECLVSLIIDVLSIGSIRTRPDQPF